MGSPRRWFKLEDGLFAASILRHTQSPGPSYYRDMQADPCVYCQRFSQEKEHIQPRSKKGVNGWENIARACSRCNRARGSMPLLQFLLWRKKGLTV